jgi:hypothetical protein
MVVHDGPGRGCEGREKSLSVRPTPTRWRLRAPPYLPEGRGVEPSSLARVRTRGNPRIRLGSSVVVVAFLPGGIAWYAAFQSARSVWISSVGATAARHLRFFVDPTSSTFLSLFFLLCFLLDVLV